MRIIDIKWYRISNRVQAVIIAHGGRRMEMVTVTASQVQMSNLKLGDIIDIDDGQISLLKSLKGQYELPVHCPNCSTHVEYDGVNLRCLAC